LSEQGDTALALQLAREWQEAIAVLAGDVTQMLELDVAIEMKEPRGHPFFWGKISVLRHFREMADKDVERFSRGAPLLAVLDAARAWRDAVQTVNGVADAEQALLAALAAWEERT
jgi:hypothetical protein